MKFQDIQLTDKTKWQQLQSEWAANQYDTALSIELANKKLTAEILNNITDKIVEVEGLNDPTYDIDKIIVAALPPKDLPTGKVWFEWTNSPSYTWEEVDQLNYTFNDVDELNLTWKYADRKGW